MPFAVLATAAAAVFVVFALTGHVWRPGEPAVSRVSPVRVPLDPAARERVLLTALDDHFQRSEMLLIEVMNASASSSGDELGFERDTADDLVASSRLYRQTAANGNARLAQCSTISSSCSWKSRGRRIASPKPVAVIACAD